jgi:hypothetical protein
MAKNPLYLTTIKKPSHENYPYRNPVSNGICTIDIGTATTHFE